MKIKSINVIMDDNTVKEYPVLDSIILAICEENDQQMVMSQISENQSLQLNLLKSIIRFDPQPQSASVENSSEEKINDEIVDDSPIEVIDEE